MGNIITKKAVKRIIYNRKKGKFDQRTQTPRLSDVVITRASWLAYRHVLHNTLFYTY